jgi:fatty-acyl-CoA synthase
VLEVAVVGMPHDHWGEVPHAFVVLRPDVATTDESLRAFAREQLAGFKVPKGFTLIAELPKTATGKIQKYILRGGRGVIGGGYHDGGAGLASGGGGGAGTQPGR